MTDQAEQIQTEAVATVEQARAVVIKDNAGYGDATAMLKRVALIRKRAVEFFAPMKAAAVRAHKAILDQEKQVLAPLVEAEGYIKLAVAHYAEAQERIRRAEELRLREEARLAEETRRLEEAAAAERAGDKEAAQAIIEAPVATPVVTLASSTPKVAGLSYRETWSFEIVDANAIPREYLVPDMTRIGQVARALKGDARIPGVRVYSVKGAAVRVG
jgi:hypothetical protein